MNYAPIVVFCYNRPEHVRRTLEALAVNAEAMESRLIIYSDGPKPDASTQDKERVAETRKVIRSKQWCKEVVIHESPQNMGLAYTVIKGVSETLDQYGSVITLEDDVLVSRYFLKFINEGLQKYANNDNVYLIAGYTFPIPEVQRSSESFFLPVTTTQAWGTWKRAWTQFDSSASGYIELKHNKELRRKFNLDNAYDFSAMLIQQMETNNISSWAIKWWWCVFKRGGLGLFPDKSLVRNIGWDGSGRHSGAKDPFFEEDWRDDYAIVEFPEAVQPDDAKFGLMIDYLKKLFGKTTSNQG